MIIDLSAVLEQVRVQHQVVALAGAVVEHGHVIAIGAAGERKRGSGVRVTTADRWHLGSCTKAITATLIARLVERGTLKWDDTVGDTLGGTLEVGPRYREVTLTELLQHRGGLAETTDGADPVNRLGRAAALDAGPDVRAARLAFARAVLGSPPASPRGTFLYSNAGYVIAAVIAEQAANLSWEELVERDVFAPLDMIGMGHGAAGNPDALNQPWGHVMTDGVPVPVPPGPAADNIPAYGPSGRLHATLKSWAKFVEAHLAGAAGNTAYLSTDSWTRLHTPPPGGGYAMGWECVTREWAGGVAWSHSGSNRSNYAVVWAAPARDGAVLIACNQGGDEAARACDDAAGAVVRDVLSY